MLSLREPRLPICNTEISVSSGCCERLNGMPYVRHFAKGLVRYGYSTNCSKVFPSSQGKEFEQGCTGVGESTVLIGVSTFDSLASVFVK